MVTRSLLLRHLKTRNSAFRIHAQPRRLMSAQLSPKAPQKPAETTPMTTSQSKNWLTRKVESSPAAKRVFLAVAKALGYGSPKQVAGTRAFAIYEQLCASKPDEDKEFWKSECYLPPTFQSWFTITNLHVWMLTVRLRALPAEHGRHYQQALIDHFFIDIEDRIRAVLQPPPTPTKPYTFLSPFYVNPNTPPTPPAAENETVTPKQRRSRAPDRIVTRQMKIFKEQWAGMGLSFDIGLVKGDQELAGAVWRNLLGARGAQGIDYASEALASTKFRRSVNLVGGEVVDVAKIDLDTEEATDDGSGVHDFAGAEVDRYLGYPETMRDVVGYVRRELKRLEGLSDAEIISGDWRKLQFGRVEKAKV